MALLPCSQDNLDVVMLFFLTKASYLYIIAEATLQEWCDLKQCQTYSMDEHE
jgi:hypothetical protein